LAAGGVVAKVAQDNYIGLPWDCDEMNRQTLIDGVKDFVASPQSPATRAT
jgi:hypothetical protein